MDRIEQQYKSRLVVIRLDIQSETGRTLAPLYSFQYTPTFIFFDTRGKGTLVLDRTIGPGTVSESLK